MKPKIDDITQQRELLSEEELLENKQALASSFKNMTATNPKTCAQILWLSEDFFTSSHSDNAVFNQNHNKGTTSFNDLHLQFLLNTTAPAQSHIQMTRSHRDGSTGFRPYMVFYNEPTNCVWAAPLSKTYSKTRNPNNETVKIPTKLYDYIHTNVSIPTDEEGKFIEPTCLLSKAFPVTPNMLTYIKHYDDSKYIVDQDLNEFLLKNFIKSQYIKKSAFEGIHTFFSSESGAKSHTYSATFALFLIGCIKENKDATSKFLASRTKTSNISQIEAYKSNYQNFVNQIIPIEAKLAEFLKYSIQLSAANTNLFIDNKDLSTEQFNAILEKRKLFNDELAKLATDISKLLPNFFSSIVGSDKNPGVLGQINLSCFDINLETMNKICKKAFTKDISIFNGLNTMLLKNADKIEQHLKTLKQKKANEDAEKKKELNEKQKQFEKERSEKAKRIAAEKAEKARRELAFSTIERIKDEHRIPDVASYCKIIQTLEDSKNKFESIYQSITAKNVGKYKSLIINKIIEFDPNIKNDIFEIKAFTEELLTQFLNEQKDYGEFATTLQTILKQKTTEKGLMQLEKDNPAAFEQIIAELQNEDKLKHIYSASEKFERAKEHINFFISHYENSVCKTIQNAENFEEKMAELEEKEQINTLKAELLLNPSILKYEKANYDQSLLLEDLKKCSSIEEINQTLLESNEDLTIARSNQQEIANFFDVLQQQIDIIEQNKEEIQKTKLQLSEENAHELMADKIVQQTKDKLTELRISDSEKEIIYKDLDTNKEEITKKPIELLEKVANSLKNIEDFDKIEEKSLGDQLSDYLEILRKIENNQKVVLNLTQKFATIKAEIYKLSTIASKLPIIARDILFPEVIFNTMVTVGFGADDLEINGKEFIDLCSNISLAIINGGKIDFENGSLQLPGIAKKKPPRNASREFCEFLKAKTPLLIMPKVYDDLLDSILQDSINDCNTLEDENTADFILDVFESVCKTQLDFYTEDYIHRSIYSQVPIIKKNLKFMQHLLAAAIKECKAKKG